MYDLTYCSTYIPWPHMRLHYITLIYWRKLSPLFLQFDNHIILPLTRLKNKDKKQIVGIFSGWVIWGSRFSSTRTAHEKIHRQIIDSLNMVTLFTFRINLQIILHLQLHTCYYQYILFPALIFNHTNYLFSSFHFSQYVYSDFYLTIAITLSYNFFLLFSAWRPYRQNITALLIFS